MALARYVVDAVVLEGRGVREVARAHGVSKSWVSVQLARFRAGGYEALAPRSRRAHSRPNRIPVDLENEIVRLRVPSGGFAVEYWTQANPPPITSPGIRPPLPWSATLALSPTDGYVMLAAEVVSANGRVGGSATCSNTVTWPGGSVTATASSATSGPQFAAKVCSDYPADSGWKAC